MRFNLRSGGWFVAVGAAWAFVLGSLVPSTAHADVFFGSDVAPNPPLFGGNVVAPFFIGNTGTGTLTINGGSVINVTGGSATVGNALEAIGIAQVTGLLSALNSAGDVTIGNLGSGSVLIESLARITAADDLFVGAGASSSGALFLDDLGTIADISDTVIVGQAGNGLVQVTGGARILADESTIGSVADSSGNVVISGFSSLWHQTNTMTVGDAGRGSLQVASQGQLETTSAVVGSAVAGIGIVSVTGADSSWQIAGTLNLGAAGQGNLNIFDGGRVNAAGVVRMADAINSKSSAVVSGANSLWQIGVQGGNASPLIVGDDGAAKLQILAGGRVRSGNAILGDTTTGRGEAVVDGNGSAWDIAGALDVSEPGEGLLTISGGGQVTTTGVTRVAAAGTIFLSGGRLTAGGTGVTNQGLVQGSGRIDGNFANSATSEIRTHVGDRLTLSGALTNAGLVHLDGGEIEVFGAATNSHDVDARDAVLRFDSGLTISAGGSLASTGGSVDVFGAVTNSVDGQIIVGGDSIAVFHDAVTNEGDVFILAGSDLLMLEDVAFSAAASLNMTLSDDEPLEEFSGAGVGGAATLAGTLAISLDGGYAPQLGDAFALVTAAGGVTGTFANEELPGLGVGLAWDVDYSPTAVTLTVVPGLTADFNGDGQVNGADLAFWTVGYGAQPNAAKDDGDADSDGDVDGSDFLAWQRESGLPAATAAGAAVPEPAAWAVALLAGGAGFVGRRRAGRRIS